MASNRFESSESATQVDRNRIVYSDDASVQARPAGSPHAPGGICGRADGARVRCDGWRNAESYRALMTAKQATKGV